MPEVTSHHVYGDLAQQFVAEQSRQTQMADLMRAATDIELAADGSLSTFE